MVVQRWAVRLVPVVVFALLACADPQTQIAEHDEAGQAYLEAEEWAEAEIEFRNMLQLDPNVAAAHWGLAQAMLGKGDPRRAYWELQETVRLDPGNLEARLQYGKFLLYGKQDDLEQAIQNADEILALDETKWQAHLLRARAFGALRKPDEAGEALRLAAEVGPEEAGPVLLYANHLRSQERNEEAEVLFRKVTEIEPGFASNAALGSFLASLARDEEAEATFRKALELAKPERRVTAYTMLANFMMSKDRIDDAEQVLRQGIDDEDDDVELIYALARFYHVQGRREQADSMIQEATQADPTDPKPFLLLSTYRGQNGDLEGALEAATQALEADPKNESARLRRAEVLVDMGFRNKDKARLSQGRAIVEAVLAKDEGSPQGLFVKTKIDLAEGRFDDGVASMRRALDARPDWAQGHYLLGSALYLSGDRAGARTAVARSIELDPNLLESQKLMTRIHAALGDHVLAVETGRRVLEAKGDDASLRILVAQSLVRKGDPTAALRELERIDPDERGAEGEYAIGRIHVLLGNREAARRDFLAGYEHAPNRYEILRALLDLELREGDIQGSVERVAAAVEAEPENARLRQLAGWVAAYSNRLHDADAAFRKAIELDPNDLRGYEGLARFLAMTGQSDEVLKTYEGALEANPDFGPLHLVVGTLYEMKKETDRAIERYEEAIRLSPELAVAKNNLAYLLADQGGNLDRALDLAQEAKGLMPDNPNAADTLGWVLYKKNVPSAAIDYLKEAVGGMQPDDAQISLVRHHLALAYEANENADEARQAWNQALKEVEEYYTGADLETPRPEPTWTPEIRAGLERVGL
ncbi:MAG: tetratricopeptide repeat protein [bacterium]|nr:tetratricopeptide repeat protein [bacterium]